jgi:hypothetical protein
MSDNKNMGKYPTMRMLPGLNSFLFKHGYGSKLDSKRTGYSCYKYPQSHAYDFFGY